MTPQQLPAAASLDLIMEWSRYNNTWGVSLEHFMAGLTTRVRDPENIVLNVCVHCMTPYFTNTMTQVNRVGWVCAADLKRHYPECSRCHERKRGTVRHNHRVYCTDCLAETHFLCRTCGTWKPHEEQRQHLHGADECCSSPALEFTFPNGGERVAQDTRMTVDLGKGTITEQGMMMIRDYIKKYASGLGNIHDGDSRANKMYRFGSRFNVGHETSSPLGNFPTRLKRHAYKEWSLKIDPEVLTQVGNLVANHSGGDSFEVEVTRDLNLPAAEFGNSQSCWWTNYKHSRCYLKSNGGIGLRAFSGKGVVGRVWVMPLRREADGVLAPTFRTDGDIWFVFNAYGALAQTVGVQVVSAMTGIDTYGSVRYKPESWYINGDGYLVAPQSVLKHHHTRLGLVLTEHSDVYETERKLTHV